ncbi:MAG: virulence protein RhuM/Fic/DOC family protein [Bacteroidales bacterium]|nr:virulence protein RhuM/Fic/DOC family protein [Bacteroidales bacterium]
MNNSSIEIYRSPEGTVELDVKLENETVWLTQEQMSILFGRDRTVITKHINNCYKEGELDKNITCAKFAHVPDLRERSYETAMYNLDVIISVGYRVKSVNGTRFRQWANKILKDYLIKGYTINKNITAERYNELKDMVRIMSRTISLQSNVSNDEYSGLFNVISDYIYALDILDGYDYQNLTIAKTTNEEPFKITYENAMQAINALKVKFGDSRWFANEKDNSFKSSIGQIYQTFGGKELYASVEEKAAMLLYLVVKNHSFSDGNKRIAAMLFLWFMEKNGILYGCNRNQLIQ